MIRFVRALSVAVACALPAVFMLQGCATLEPLPRFRASSTSFDPEQLPPAQRSASDLVDASIVGAYSRLKEDARPKAAARPSDDVRQMVINQSAAPMSLHVDEVGLDIEALEDEMDSGDEFSEEEPPVDESIITRVVSRSMANNSAASDETLEANPAVNRGDLMKEIVNLLGVRYRFGGMDAVKGIDCSAFVGTIYSRALGMSLPRSSNQQFGVGNKVQKNDLKVGDLVFFRTSRRRGPVSHVGIYVGGNLFAHASSKHGVIVSTLESGYYAKTYVGARRIKTNGFSGISGRR